MANFYFLVIAIISLTPYSPISATLSIMPLVFVISVSAIKEAIEDIRRHKMDNEINNLLVKVLKLSPPKDFTFIYSFIEFIIQTENCLFFFLFLFFSFLLILSFL